MLFRKSFFKNSYVAFAFLDSKPGLKNNFGGRVQFEQLLVLGGLVVLLS